MAVPITSANTTADATISSSTPSILMGYSINEDATTAAVAEVVIRNGTSTAGPIVAQANLAANGAASEWFGPNGIVCKDGIFVDRLSGTTTVVVYIQ